MKNAIAMAKGCNLKTGVYYSTNTYTENDILYYLNQPKLPDLINLEMEEDGVIINKSFPASVRPNYKLKTTSTPEGEVIIVKI